MATALELHRAGWRSYVENVRPRLGRPSLSAPEAMERAELLARVREAVRQLKEAFPVRRVILFGSLAQYDVYRQLRALRKGGSSNSHFGFRPPGTPNPLNCRPTAFGVPALAGSWCHLLQLGHSGQPRPNPAKRAKTDA